MPGKSIHALMRPGKPNIWATGKFRKIMKSTRVDDIMTFANSLNKTEEVKVSERAELRKYSKIHRISV